MSEVKAHSKYSASSASRWLACPGSIALIEKAPPQSTSKYAEEGTKAHDLAEKVLREMLTTDKVDLSKYEFDDRDMVDGAYLYADYIAAVLIGMSKATALVEERTDLSNILEPGCFGTVDAALYDANTLHVFDYKYGAGYAVEPKDNPQLIYYAIGIMYKATIEIPKIECHIIQPRAFHAESEIRSASLTYNELNSWVDRFRLAIRESKKPNADLVAGKHCKFCPAAVICPQISQRALAEAKADFTVTTPPKPEAMSINDIKAVLDRADLIETWISAVRAHALNLLERGQEVPGYKLVEKRALRKWASAEVVTKRARELFGDQAFVTELKSPAQLEKIKGAKDFVKDHSSAVSSGVTMVKQDDKRQALNQLETDFKSK